MPKYFSLLYLYLKKSCDGWTVVYLCGDNASWVFIVLRCLILLACRYVHFICTVFVWQGPNVPVWCLHPVFIDVFTIVFMLYLVEYCSRYAWQSKRNCLIILYYVFLHQSWKKVLFCISSLRVALLSFIFCIENVSCISIQKTLIVLI